MSPRMELLDHLLQEPLEEPSSVYSTIYGHGASPAAHIRLAPEGLRGLQGPRPSLPLVMMDVQLMGLPVEP